jgi:hypothetical protein
MNSPGRSCPIHYRYTPAALAQAEPLRARTLYVVGGVYGNVVSLREVLAMRRDEQQRSGERVDLLFNGDFNWLNVDAESFAEVNETVLEHGAMLGNVEAELGSADMGNGCGCNYPDHVEDQVVERSNAIMDRLRRQARVFPELGRRVAGLPMFRRVEVGGQAIAVVHGDAESLAGWGFAFEAMPPTRGEPKVQALAAPTHVTPAARIAEYFRAAQVCGFACTHTGLPVMQDFHVDGQRRLIVNNGAAGLPNFHGKSYGLLTRISARTEVPASSLYGTTLAGIRFDALPIRYAHAEWLAHFLRNWPAGSPGHAGYFKRISQGPDFSVRHAVRIVD